MDTRRTAAPGRSCLRRPRRQRRRRFSHHSRVSATVRPLPSGQNEGCGDQSGAHLGGQKARRRAKNRCPSVRPPLVKGTDGQTESTILTLNRLRTNVLRQSGFEWAKRLKFRRADTERTLALTPAIPTALSPPILRPSPLGPPHSL